MMASNDGNAVAVSLMTYSKVQVVFSEGVLGFPPTIAKFWNAIREIVFDILFEYRRTELIIHVIEYLSHLEPMSMSSQSSSLVPKYFDWRHIIAATSVRTNRINQPFCSSIFLLTNFERKSNVFTYCTGFKREK
jgi:hypothetical protein